MRTTDYRDDLTRRRFLGIWATVAASTTSAAIFRSGHSFIHAAEPNVPVANVTGPKGAVSKAAAGKPTQFQHACMTLPYSDFPLGRALAGIKAAGYRFVAWGTQHREENGEQVPVLAEDAPPEKAQALAKRCRDIGLEPVLMFSNIYPEHKRGLEVLKQRIKQAAAAGIAQVLTFGHTQGGNRPLWVERFKVLGPLARDHGELRVVPEFLQQEEQLGQNDVRYDQESISLFAVRDSLFGRNR